MLGSFLNAIQPSDASLQSVMVSMKTDSGPNSMQNNLEEDMANIFPYDPVAKKCGAGKKRNVGFISSTDASWLVSSVSMKASIGKKAFI